MAKKATGGRRKRPEILEGAPLHYAPENELGVVFLFSHIAKKKYRLTIDEIHAGFPDCIAYQKTGDGDKKVRIEFEFKSRNFKNQRHPAKGCDWIVCWEHNWPDVPKGLQVIELRKEYGLGFNVWIQAVGGEYKESLSEYDSCHWTVPSQASKGDLILFYRNQPDKCIREIFRLTEKVSRSRVKNKIRWNNREFDYSARIQVVCRLKAPIFLEDLRRDRILGTASFVRGDMQGRLRTTEYWPYLYDMIIRRNSSVAKKLKKYAPDRI